jgi:membrane protein
MTRRNTALRFLRSYVREVDEDRVLGLAAETAFFAVLSIFPGLLVAVSLLGLLDVLVGGDVADGAQERVVSAISLVLTDRASEALAAVENLFDDRRGGLLTFATIGALVTLSGGFAVAVNALNLAYDIEERRSWLRRRLLGLALAVVTLLVLVLALAVVVVGPLFGQGRQLAELVGLGAAFAFTWNVLRLPVLFVVLVAWTTALLAVAPNGRIRLRDALPGAVLTTGLWLVASAGFRLYLEIVADRNPVLGAFGGGIIVMTWVYLLSVALLLGGELNATLKRVSTEPRSGDATQLALFRD